MFRLFTLFTCFLLLAVTSTSAYAMRAKPEFFTVTFTDMWAYWLLFLTPASLAFSPVKFDKNVNYILWAIVGLLCILIVGLRFQVGGDWDNYLGHLDRARVFDFSFIDAVAVSWGNAIGYMLVNWAAHKIGGGIYFVNTFCATVFIGGLVLFCRKQPFPWIALAVAIPYMVCAVAMGYTRQSAAIGFLLCGLSILRSGNELKYIVLIFLGSLFHLSILITLPLVILTREKIHWLVYPFCGLFFYGIFTLLTQINTRGGASMLEGMTIIWEYTRTRESAGGVIRTYLNAVPVFVSLFYWNRIKMISTDFKIIKWMAIACVLAIPALVIGPTLVDRLGLYLMPVQVALWPRLIAVQRTTLLRSSWAASILAFYGLVLYVFFQYAVHSHLWIPYRMWPFSSEPVYPLPFPV